MASFEGIQWAETQLCYTLKDKQITWERASAKVHAVSRSIHYGMFLAFEGIRFFCRKAADGTLELVFVNWRKNLARFREGISFNLSQEQQWMVPEIAELENLLLSWFRHPGNRTFVENMARNEAQGYVRPFTVDEEQSIGVTFPGNPAIRVVACQYERYLGEPFSGVVIPNMVRAIRVNGTGRLKLGINYLISVKAIDLAKKMLPDAASALFLDDRPDLPITKRVITEWDSSCCLIMLEDGTVIKIPESPLILPSVTIQGVVGLLKMKGVPVVERDFTYEELIDNVAAHQIVAVCSVGTAGILNRCNQLLLVDQKLTPIETHQPLKDHALYHFLGTIKELYWDAFKSGQNLPVEMERNVYSLS